MLNYITMIVLTRRHCQRTCRCTLIARIASQFVSLWVLDPAIIHFFHQTSTATCYAVYTMQCIKNKQVPPLQTDGASIIIVLSFTRSRDTSWRTVALNSLMFYSNNMNDSQRLSHVKISIVNMSHARECGKIISYCTS